MRNLMDFALILVGFVLFLPNNYVSFISIGFSLLGFISFIVIYSIKRKKDANFKENIVFDKSIIIIILMVISLNLIHKYEYFNLLFFNIMSVYFIIRMIIRLFKKDFLFETRVINLRYVYEIYSYSYLILILINLLNYKL